MLTYEQWLSQQGADQRMREEGEALRAFMAERRTQEARLLGQTSGQSAGRASGRMDDLAAAERGQRSGLAAARASQVAKTPLTPEQVERWEQRIASGDVRESVGTGPVQKMRRPEETEMDDRLDRIRMMAEEVGRLKERLGQRRSK